MLAKCRLRRHLHRGGRQVRPVGHGLDHPSAVRHPPGVRRERRPGGPVPRACASPRPSSRSARDVEPLCPEATVFCYSNPMTAIATTVHRRFPQLKFVGMCHEIASLDRYLPAILGTAFENLAPARRRPEPLQRAAGGELRGLGEGRLPRHHGEGAGVLREGDRLQRRPGVRPAHGQKRPRPKGRRTGSRSGRDRARGPGPTGRLFRFIMERFHLLPITTDSHLGEYVAGPTTSAITPGSTISTTCTGSMLATVEPEIELKLPGAHRADDRGGRHQLRAARGGGQRPQRRADPLRCLALSPSRSLPSSIRPACTARRSRRCRRPSGRCSGTTAACTT